MCCADPARRRWLAGAAGLLLPAARAERPHTALPTVSVVEPGLAMPGLGRTRTLRVCVPPGYAEGARRYPVIYMHDGQNLFDDATSYAGEWGVDETLARLARERGFEAIVVGIDHGGERRLSELMPWPTPRFPVAEGAAYLDFVVGVVKPFVDARWRTLPARRHTAMIGSSLGGLVTQFALARHPQVFGRAGIFSPSYWVSDAVYDSVRRAAPPPDTRICLYAGGQEDERMLPDLERMRALLAATRPASAMAVHVDPAAHHDESAWRAELPRALAWLFELDGPTKP